MGLTRPRYNKEDFAERGDAIYDRIITSDLETARAGEFVAIDLLCGAPHNKSCVAESVMWR
jgi:hypothetical protein